LSCCSPSSRYSPDEIRMGNYASSSAEESKANERKAIRSLGDRYPLGDAELRKWCWIHERLSSATQPPVATTQQSQSSSTLSSLAGWSAIYGDYNPHNRRSQSQSNSESNNIKNPIRIRLDAANKALEAIGNVEQHILPDGLSSIMDRCALGLPLKAKVSSQQSSSKIDPIHSAKSLTKIEEISDFEESYYTITSCVSQYLASSDSSPYATSSTTQSLEDFLEEISVSCGRRGSRASLSKLFAISGPNDNKNQQGKSGKVEASAVIRTAYCLTLTASYLKQVAATMKRKKGETVNWKEFVPQNNTQNMQSMVDSLLNSAMKQRRDRGGMGGNFGFDYSRPTTTSNAAGPSNNDDTTVSLEEFLEWAETTTPMMSALPTFLFVLFAFFSPALSGDGKEPPFPHGVTPLWIPSLTIDQPIQSKYTSPTSSFFPAPSSSSFDLFALCCTSLTLASGRWHRLFSSEANGLSCNRLMHSLLGYGGPTIILIRSKDLSDKGECGSGVFGVYTFTPWSQESSGFYGNSDCFLFRLGPDPMAVYRPKGGGDTGGMDAFGTNSTTSNEESETRNYMYFNPEARSKGYDGLAHGIGFGGTSDSPRLFIDEVLDGCRAASEDLTYDKGPLLSGLKESISNTMSHFEVEAIEAWGVGTQQVVNGSLLARDGEREDAQKRIRQAMKGAKGAFLEDMQSGLMGNKNFQHRDQMRGRDGGCDMDEAEE